MLKVLLTGAQGLLGQEIKAYCRAREICELIGFDKSELDITDPEAIQAALSEHQPDWVINAAADLALEEAEALPQRMEAVNALGPKWLAHYCRALGIKLFHFSTDYIFDGTKDSPYLEEDPPHPISVYGRTKCDAEQAIQAEMGEFIILRIAWVFGRYGNDFVKKILSKAEKDLVIQVVEDQIGTPTSAKAIVETVFKLLQAPKYGIYHYAGTPAVSWYSYAKYIIEKAKPLKSYKVQNIIPIKTAELPLQAKRPAFSALATHKIERDHGISAPPWQPAVNELIEELIQDEISA